MALSDTDAAFARDLFSRLGDITTRKMMGGLCLYHGGVIFAIVHGNGSIWLKGGGTFGSALEAEGSRRWTYTNSVGRTVAMPYWSLPEAALDDPGVACDWANRALAHL